MWASSLCLCLVVIALTVKDILDAARMCALEIRRIEEEHRIRREAIGVQGHSYDVHSKTGVRDPMRLLVDYMDWENEQVAEVSREPIEEAYEIVDGASHVTDSLTIEVITRYYLQAESLVELARDLAANRNLGPFHTFTRKQQIETLESLRKLGGL